MSTWIKKLVAILSLIATLSGIFQGAAQIYYISPVGIVNGTCASENVSPCYQMHQLNSTLLSNKNRLLLLLLPGTHTISGNDDFSATNLQELETAPYFEDMRSEVTCGSHVHLTFRNIASLTISQVSFSSCTLRFVTLRARYQTSVDIIGCLFQSAPDYPIIVDNVSIVTITVCEFSFNNGAIHYLRRATSLGLVTLNVVHSTFTDNHVIEGNGGTIQINTVDLTIISSTLIRNSASYGGAINARSSKLTLSNNNFTENNASMSGGAIHCINCDMSMDASHFQKNSAGDKGGAVYIEQSTTYTQIYGTVFIFNRANASGGALHCRNGDSISIFLINGSSEFNSAASGGFAHLFKCYLEMHSKYAIAGNKAMSGGAIFLDNSVINFHNTFCNITQNSALEYGGGMYLLNSNILFKPAATITFSNNSATSPNGKGGSIFVSDDDCDANIGPARLCFAYFDLFNETERKIFIFVNNQASGSVLYGGLLDRCIPDYLREYPLGVALEAFKSFSQYTESPLAITSETVRLCLCSSKTQLYCSLQDMNTTKMRGEVLTLTLSALDQYGVPVAATVRASYRDIQAEVDQGEERKEIFSECEELQYRIYARDSTATLILQPEGPCGESSLSSVTINVEMVPCSIGFEQEHDRCTCDRRLRAFNIRNCDINTKSVEKTGLIWLRYDEEKLMVFENCLDDFCDTRASEIYVSDPDQQCANHRSGVLCGACQHSYSIVLGSSKCLQCPSRYNFIWLLLVFAVAGAVLVAFLLLFNLTISAGTLNGLIFYVNVVSISGLTSLRNCSIHPILSVFIAWANLDLGIETCFFQGMDTVHKTWLQFVFPLYIWLLVGTIIVVSYYSSRAMKIFGRNNIAILATLFLLSYSKIFKTIITALTFSQVLVGRADNVTHQLTPYKVWTYDGNIDYLKGKHILLFVVAVTYLLVFLMPYTLILTFDQCLRPILVKKGLSWVHKTGLTSLLDAYHAPYNKQHTYWTGLMLLARCILYSAFTINYNKDIFMTKMYTITLVLTALLTIKTFSSKIYNNKYNDLLDLGFLINLGILTLTLHYLKGKASDDGAICRSITASVSVSLVIFFGILLYHVYMQLKEKQCFASIVNLFLMRFTKCKSHEPLIESVVDTNLDDVTGVQPPSTTLLELAALKQSDEDNNTS